MPSKSSTITDALESNDAVLEPIPPGEILLEDFMKPLGVSQNRLARDIDVPVSRISGIVKGERAITADTALRLARFFDTSPEMWMALQADHDLRLARLASGQEIEKRVRPLAA
jgi:addiction module HigA family antidote